MSEEHITLLDWRRRVADLYVDVRRALVNDPAAAHRMWRTGRDELFRTHPQSPLPPAERPGFKELPYFAYDRVKQGLFDVTSKLFGVTYRPVTTVPVWDKSVEDFAKGIDRTREHQPVPQQIADWIVELRSTHAGTNRPSLKKMAEERLAHAA